MVHVSKNLGIKPASNPLSKSNFVDPFEDPPSKNLYIGNVSDTHSLMFNKFNLLDNHLLIVTNEFELQESPLTLADFEAFWGTVEALNGVGFFNCGPKSGASQPHKHFQFIPLPLTPEYPDLPITPILTALEEKDGENAWCFTRNTLPFDNFISIFPEEATEVPRHLLALHTQFMKTLTNMYNSESYNILLCPKWIMFIPRQRDEYETVSGNATTFAGTIFVKTLEQLDVVKSLGPMKIACELGFQKQEPFL